MIPENATKTSFSYFYISFGTIKAYNVSCKIVPRTQFTVGNVLQTFLSTFMYSRLKHCSHKTYKAKG